MALAGRRVRRVRLFLKRRQMSQNALARVIGRDISTVSKVLRGTVQSAPIWTEIEAYMADPDGYRIRDRKQRLAVARARKVLKRSGFLA